MSAWDDVLGTPIAVSVDGAAVGDRSDSVGPLLGASYAVVVVVAGASVESVVDAWEEFVVASVEALAAAAAAVGPSFVVADGRLVSDFVSSFGVAVVAEVLEIHEGP